MLEKFLQKKFAVPLILLVIMIAAFWVRIYNHEEWLYFKMDHARDAFLIANALENGPGDLPLLGPRAGSTELDQGFLRLGPIFYYFQYLSGVIFSSSAPQVFAYPDLFFSILTLPLLYLFCRLYFKRYISLIIVFLYAFSFLVIEYSRFAWNPNSLPFFTILSFFALIKFLNAERVKWRSMWMAIFSLGLAVGSQLHFVGFFSLVGASVLLLAYHFKLWKLETYRKIISWQVIQKIALYLVIFLAVFVVFYTPVIISDVIKGGENSRNFIEALGSKPTEETIFEKLGKNILRQVQYYTIILTSYVYAKKMGVKDFLPIIFTLAVFAGALFLAIKKLMKLSEPIKKDFLMLIILWLGVFFVLCIPLAFQLRPRFFLVTLAAPFILLGLIFEFLEAKFYSRRILLISLLTAIVFFSNAFGTFAWFKEQADSQKGDVPIRRTLILKTKDGVTLGQLQKTANYIYARKKPGHDIYFYVKPEHVRPVNYLFKLKNDPAFRYETMDINSDPNAQYFAIVPTGSETSKVEKKFKEELETIASQTFGQISVYEINFKNRQISADLRTEEENEEGEDRVFWKDVFRD